MSDKKILERFGSIRTRLALLYSILFFGLASIIVGGVYISLSRAISDDQISQKNISPEMLQGQADGEKNYENLENDKSFALEEFSSFEKDINRNTLEKLRTYVFLALAGLLSVSLLVGWYVAGLVIKPIKHISSVAHEISATDLSRRIDLGGSADELRDLADIFDDMLDRLDAAFRNQREFLQDAAHELRNPLAVLKANLDVVATDPEATIEDFRFAGEIADRTISRMGALVDALLLYAQHERSDVKRLEVDIAEVLKDTVQDFYAAAESSGVVLELELDLPLNVMGDFASLRRSVANLLSNSIRVSKNGTSVHVSAGHDSEMVWISVRDEGPGIDSVQIEKVFDRFWRGDQALAREDGRSGLGLAIVKNITEGHGGRTTLRSTLGVGSTFTIWLPRLVKT